jgi:hypothetical protein
MENVEKALKGYLNNPAILGLAMALTIMYGPRLSPKLPSPLRNLFDMGIFRFLVMVLVIYLGSYDIRLSLLVAILFVIVMDVIGQEKMKEAYQNQVNEYYANYNLYGSNTNNNEHFANKRDVIKTGIGYSCGFTIKPSQLEKAVKNLGEEMTKTAGVKLDTNLQNEILKTMTENKKKPTSKKLVRKSKKNSKKTRMPKKKVARSTQNRLPMRPKRQIVERPELEEEEPEEEEVVEEEEPEEEQEEEQEEEEDTTEVEEEEEDEY